MSKKKILLLGATGMAGHVVFLYLNRNKEYDITTVVYRNKLTEDCIVLDVRDKEQVADIIRTRKPDVIINCIGVLIQEANENPADAILLNAFLPNFLAKMADETGAKLIHISTDCVFSGKKGQYAESDFKDADDIYGRSKALGEVASKPHLTLRTSIIGPEIKRNGTGLFHWFMNQSGEVKGFTGAYWGGVTTLELARAIEKAIKNDLSGLIQLTNGEKISKYDLLLLFKEIWDKNAVQLVEFKGKTVDKSLLMTNQFNFEVPGYREMLTGQKSWMDTYQSLYKEIY